MVVADALAIVTHVSAPVGGTLARWESTKTEYPGGQPS